MAKSRNIVTSDVCVDNKVAQQIIAALEDAGIEATEEVLVAQLWIVISTFIERGLRKESFFENIKILWEEAADRGDVRTAKKN